MPDNKPTIEAERRRPGGSSKPVGRAEAPVRRRPAAGGGGGGFTQPPSSGGGGGGYVPSSGGGGFSLPGGRGGKLGIGTILLLVVLFFVFKSCLGGSGGLTSLPPASDNQNLPELAPTEIPVDQPTRVPTKPRPTRTPGAATGNTWTVMLYQDADDKILEKDIYVDLNEAERIGSSPNVQIVAQVDRFQGAFTGDGDWVSARRYFITQDDDLSQVNSEMVADLGEANMASGQTLVDFAVWAIKNYPADKYALILSDHGMGWPGGWTDPTSRSANSSIPLASVTGDMLFLDELTGALQDIRSQTGLDKFELLGMDACLMGHLEVFTDLAPNARYAVTSQETEPSLGWAYASFLERLAANPDMDGAALGEAIVKTYITEDQRIVDDTARADFVGRGSVMGSLFGAASVPSAAQVERELTPNITLSAVDLSLIPDVMNRFNDFVFAMQQAAPRDVAQARSYAQSFTSIFGQQVPASYIDLGHFASLVSRTSGLRSVAEASTALQETISQAVIAERHGSNKPGATGISIYFPNSSLYSSAQAGMQSYTVAARTFAEQSLWDEFLAFQYTGQGYERASEVITLPGSGVPVRAPASGGIQISQVQASARSVAPGGSIRLTADISGENIGYIRFMAGYLDSANNSVNVADSDYLQSSQSQELNGVFYPDWGETDFTLAFNWEPLVFAINDGTNSAVALLNPETYGASPEEAVYRVEGLYTFADSGEQSRANLYFSNGQLRSVFGFTGTDGEGAPREITPQRGDTVTLYEKWMDLDAQGKVVEVVLQEGETLTFGNGMFTWEQLYAAPGDYIVGFIVEDLDGQSQMSFTQVVVQ